MRFFRAAVGGMLAMLALGGCGDAAGDDPSPPFDYNGSWVVEGARCQGQEVLRLVEVGPAGALPGELMAQYLRGDACVSLAGLFWQGSPAHSGEVELGSERASVARQGADRLRIAAEDGELVMTRVFPETGPAPMPEIEDLSLSGQWLMEGYPCDEEQVPQLVQVSHVSGTVSVTKTLGDACMEAGVRFIEGTVEGTRISGEAFLEPPDGWGGDEGVEVSGRVRVPEYFRLDVLGVAVGFRRVLGND